jgi:hypothetical protein
MLAHNRTINSTTNSANNHGKLALKRIGHRSLFVNQAVCKPLPAPPFKRRLYQLGRSNALINSSPRRRPGSSSLYFLDSGFRRNDDSRINQRIPRSTCCAAYPKSTCCAAPSASPTGAGISAPDLIIPGRRLLPWRAAPERRIPIDYGASNSGLICSRSVSPSEPTAALSLSCESRVSKRARARSRLVT